MKNIFGIAMMVLFLSETVLAQEYKLAKSTGRLEIVDVNEVIIESNSANEIIFSSKSRAGDQDERAKGLRAVSSLCLEDNTGLGLSVVDKGGVIEVRQLKKMDGPDITIKIPKGIVVSYRHSSPYGSGFKIKNIENEIDVSTVHNTVSLENATGPIHVETVHGDVDVVFGAIIKSPVNITSVHGHVDVAIPEATKANLSLSTAWGELLVDSKLKIEREQKGGMVKYSDNFSGKINGGGTDIALSSTHNNVYLRLK